ncbi:MAG TPA: DUF1801 domain-containing protein [Anaerolineales bacterium]
MAKSKPASVEEYIQAAPEPAQARLRAMRAILKEIAPNASETVKWGSLVFEENRILFAYRAHKAHLNFVPTGPAMEPFKDDLAGYKTGKDSIQFPYDKPLPKALIQKIAAYRFKEVTQNDARWVY